MENLKIISNKKKLIIDYINGEDLDYPVEELENNPKFMMQVIDFIGDKNFYNLCSENVKKNHHFVLFMIKKFRNDINFICSVAEYYLDNEKDEQNKLEIIILMTNFTNKKNEEKHSKYKFLRDSNYGVEKIRMEMTKAYLDSEDRLEIGEGFSYFLEKYRNKKIITDFFAKKTINSIFYDHDIDLEKYLHKRFNDTDSLEKYGINKFMIDFISKFDKSLSYYIISNNIFLLSDFKNKIKKIISNWDGYNERVEFCKYDYVIQKVYDSIYYYHQDNLSVIELLYYVGRELDILKKICEYDCTSEKEAESILKKVDEFLLRNKLSFTDKVIYNNIKELIKSVVFSDDFEEPDEYLIDKTKGRILEFKKA